MSLTRQSLRRGGVGLALGALAIVPLMAQTPAPAESFVAGFTASTFGGLNRADAQAAVSLWANEIASTRQLHITVSTEFYETIDEVRRAVDARRVHLLLLSVPQYHALRRPDFGDVMAGSRAGSISDRFLLVTKRGGIPSLAALKGKSLNTIDGLADDMSRVWLESTLANHGLPPATAHFGTVTRTPKPARGVLPVYFGQADACLVTRSAFQTLAELNPQIGQGLIPLEESAPLVSAIALLDRAYAPRIRERLLDALVHLQDTVRGRQVLHLFGVDGMTLAAPEALAVSLTLARSTAGRRAP